MIKQIAQTPNVGAAVPSDLYQELVEIHARLRQLIDRANPGDPPATATAAGTAGQFAFDAAHLYVCVAANTWRRVSLGDW